MFYKIQDDSIIVNVKLIPNSSINKIIEISEDSIKIKLQAPPVDFKANLELEKFIAKFLNIPKSSVKLLKGEKSKNKVLKISNLKQIDFEKSIKKLNQ